MSQNSTLEELVSMSFLKNDGVLRDLLQELIKREDAILFVGDFSKRNIIYMDPTVDWKLGYSAEDFLAKGADRIYEITNAKYIPAIIDRQVYYLNMARQPGFDPKSVIIMEFPCEMITSERNILEIVCLSVVLTYTKNAEFEFGLCVISDADTKTLEQCSSLLRKIKLRHNEIYVHSPFVPDKHILGQVLIATERTDKKITPREEEVLALLARGYSTEEIAESLVISVNTVESHRKNLLRKFEAKNTAELIKKASKVFWLE